MQIYLKLFLLSLLLFINPAWADTKIAVPAFELLDLTGQLSDPQKASQNEVKEQQKLREIELLLREDLASKAGFTLVNISDEDKNAADKGAGYLFDNAKAAAELGLEHGADYILIGRVHKPSFLFSYLIVRVIDTHEKKLVKEFRSEMKGDPKKTIPGVVGHLVNNIDGILPH